MAPGRVPVTSGSATKVAAAGRTVGVVVAGSRARAPGPVGSVVASVTILAAGRTVGVVGAVSPVAGTRRRASTPGAAGVGPVPGLRRRASVPGGAGAVPTGLPEVGDRLPATAPGATVGVTAAAGASFVGSR